MINALWRFILTLIYITCLLLVLAIVWEVPKYIGHEIPPELAKLPLTLLTVLALITGIWGTWSRSSKKLIIPDDTRKHFTDPIVPKDDIFSAPPSTGGELSMVEQANQIKKNL